MRDRDEAIILDASQMAAVEKAVSRRLSVVNGGAGTGKIVAAICRRLAESGQPFALCAFAAVVRRATSRDHEPTGYNLAHIPARWREAGGEGVRVLVIDTGAPTHRDLVPVIDYEASESFLWREGIGDENGHATHVCSVLHDWAPKARIVCYRVAGADGKADYSAVRTALETAARLPEDMRSHVVNISLSAKSGASKWRSPICRLYRSGVPVFCGAGNGGEGGGRYIQKTGYHTRDVFYYQRKDFRGTIFAQLRRGTIHGRPHIYEGWNLARTYKSFTASHATTIFWVLWCLIIGLCVFAFVSIDNRWLEEGKVT